MTDNEIKKRLAELRKNQEDGYTTHLEYGGKRDLEQEEMLDLFGATLDLINRKKAEIQAQNEKLHNRKSEVNRLNSKVKSYKAEIERLKTAFENSQKATKYWHSKCGELVEDLQIAKAEAYKEFAERLKQVLYNDEYILIRSIIDNLLKEMVGDKQ